MIEDKIVSLLEEKFKEEEFRDFYLVDLEFKEPARIAVFVDADSGLNTVKCAKLSRYLEEYLDEKNWKNGKYILEVSSPGVDRPLKFPRQYVKNIGKKIDIKTAEGEDLRATLKDANEDFVVLEYRDKIKQGKKKKYVAKHLELLYKNIKKAKIRISIN